MTKKKQHPKKKQRTEQIPVAGLPTLVEQISYMTYSVKLMKADPEVSASMLKMEMGILENLIALRMLVERMVEKNGSSDYFDAMKEEFGDSKVKKRNQLVSDAH